MVVPVEKQAGSKDVIVGHSYVPKLGISDPSPALVRTEYKSASGLH